MTRPYDHAAETDAIRGWLGPLAHGTDTDAAEERVERVRTAWHAVNQAAAWDADDTTGRQAAADAAAQYMLGDLTVAQAADAVLRARAVLADAEDRLRGTCLAALADGRGVTKIAREAGVATNTVYRWRDGRTDQ
ncbi:helix-turn-helix domain-containing protein [Actinomyces sp. 432]|uniref:helix-turn-helix domain-containing protein n=1 Tax=Actinomyces sp. 432 TaxID=2057798 RepID=UPI00137B28F2|nr:helix-turn-helix domain-containing protein [Actinomyces sp. 432]